MNLGLRLIRMFACLGIASALFFAVSAQGAEIVGVKLDDAVRVGNQELKLNGAGVRYKAVFKVYVAALYLAEKKSTVAEALAAPGAKRVTLIALRDVSSEDLGRGFMSGLHQNSDKAEKARFVMQLQRFGEIFAAIPELKKGDVLNVDWLPGSGTAIHLNGKQISEVLPDAAFYNALLKIWLGDKPVDARLKPQLLGERPDDKGRGAS